MKPGALIARKFRLTRQIGEGAMGEVWAATNESTGGEFALKFILKSTKDLRERLMREARAAGGIRHPNVIRMYEVCVFPCINPVYELMDRWKLYTRAE